MAFPLRTRTRGRPSRNAGVVNVAAAPSFNPLTSWTTDPVHGVWASDPLWTPPADGGAVSSWRNGGSVGGDLVQATGSKQPTYDAVNATFNSQAVVSFATDDVLSPASSIADLPSWQAVIIGRFSATASTYAIIAGGTSTRRFGVAAGQWHARWGTSLNAGTADTNPHLLVAGNISGGYSVDGVSTGITLTNEMNDLYLGGQDATPNAPFSGDIALALVFTTDPTAQAEWATFKAWVTSTYGITIA